MQYLDFLLISSSLLTSVLLIAINRKINHQLEKTENIEEFLTKKKESEKDCRSILMTRLGEIQTTRFSSYFKNHGD